jgi:hypothetical protein
MSDCEGPERSSEGQTSAQLCWIRGPRAVQMVASPASSKGYAACAPSAPGPSLSGVTSPAPAPSRPRDVFRSVAAGVCGLQAVALLGFVVFYLWELTQDSADDPVRVVMSALLIAVFAVGIGAMARGWLRGDNWPNTPTVVWNLLLIPVGWSLVQSDRGLVGALVIVMALVGIVAAVRADTTDAEDVSPD